MPFSESAAQLIWQWVVPMLATQPPDIFQGRQDLWGRTRRTKKLRTDRCVTESLSPRLTPLLTTNLSMTWSQLRPRTCNAASELIAAVRISLLLLALVLGGFSFMDKLGTFLKKFVRLNPLNFSSSTKLRLNVKAVSFWIFPRPKVVIHVSALG